MRLLLSLSGAFDMWFIRQKNGRLAMSSKGTPIWYSNEEAAFKAIRTNYHDGVAVQLPTVRDSAAYNGRRPV